MLEVLPPGSGFLPLVRVLAHYPPERTLVWSPAAGGWAGTRAELEGRSSLLLVRMFRAGGGLSEVDRALSSAVPASSVHLFLREPEVGVGLVLLEQSDGRGFGAVPVVRSPSRHVSFGTAGGHVRRWRMHALALSVLSA